LGDLLEDLDVEIPLGDQTFQPAVFLLEVSQTFHIGRLERGEMFPPGVDRLRADAVLLGDLRDRLFVGLTQNRDHLLFGEPRLLRGSLAARGRHSLRLQLVRKTPGTSDRSRHMGKEFPRGVSDANVIFDGTPSNTLRL